MGGAPEPRRAQGAFLANAGEHVQQGAPFGAVQVDVVDGGHFDPRARGEAGQAGQVAGLVAVIGGGRRKVIT